MSPPISKNQPPVSGAIMWCRSLFQRIKGTVLRFQTMKELFDSDAGKAVSEIDTQPITILDLSEQSLAYKSRFC